jgi:hypothetical protein
LAGKKLNIIVAGYIVCGPIGGLVWHHLQYVLGLSAMGCDVLFVEDSQDYPSCYHPITYQLTTDPSYGLHFLQTVFAQYNLKDRWAYFDYHTNQWYGKSKQELEAIVDNADIFLNLSGVDPLREHFQMIPVRAFIDTDPAFTQIRHLTEAAAMTIAKKHNRFFSFGENFGKASCQMPDDGFHWLPTRQPVVMNAWYNPNPTGENTKWTTVMQWDSYKSREINGKKFGMKSMSFDAYVDLPGKVNDQIELALGSVSAPREQLIAQGWSIIDPLPVSLTPAAYQSYIHQSKGEWSVAKHGYVVSNCGWFSERSACYLASGKPVVVQDTGFSDLFETGKGLFGFSNPNEAIHSMETINKDYKWHCRCARIFAEENFRADAVLTGLLDHL